MPSYKAPLDDIRFVLNQVVGMKNLAALPAFETVDEGTVNGFLDVTAQYAQEVLTPLNASGDAQGCTYDRDQKAVTTPDGFVEAYQQFCELGLTALACDPDFGGLGMPQVLNTAVGEMFCSANMSFGMYPGLSHGAYNALAAYGTDEQKRIYLPKLVSGQWTGTMCLTEPGCGTDLGLMKTKAQALEDGSYKITGEKIFISAGEHDLAENICHLVLAKIEDPSTPPGIKGVSLFLVPKFIPDEGGSVGARNSAYCTGLEEKMGIHANSTCKMFFDGAVGHLVGEAGGGMRAMFVMMNEARLGVGLQGLGLSEVSYQNALNYAQERLQGRAFERMQNVEAVDPIIVHPDVRRELLTMKATTEGDRALILWASYQLDLSLKHPDEALRRQAKNVLDYLIPIVKAHLTDNAVNNTNSGMQIFGGHGYIREHGMEQFNRDARITRLYEGTNGIQALDLIGRKTLDKNLAPYYFREISADLKSAVKARVPMRLLYPFAVALLRLRLRTLMLRLGALIRGRKGLARTLEQAAGVSYDYLKMASYVAVGHMWIKMATAAQESLAKGMGNEVFYRSKIETAHFYMKKILPLAAAHDKTMSSGADVLMKMSVDLFEHGQGDVAASFQDLPAPVVRKPWLKFLNW